MAEIKKIQLPDGTEYDLKDTISGYITDSDIPVTSVNSQTGDVVLSASDVGALPDTTTIPTATSDLTNDSGFITSASVPSAGTGNPVMDGTASAGSATTWSRSDHVHPTDTSRAAVSHEHSASDITSGTLAVARGGTGKTTLNDAANALINSLTEGTSDPTDNDYYVSQYVSGGTTTTTYHRRPISKLWNYMKSKITSAFGSQTAASGGTTLGMVTTGEKYTWNNKLSSHQTIKIDGITGATSTRYAACSTAAATAAKTANVTAGTFSLATGSVVFVKFTNSNTVESPTLNINSTGAKAIKRYGTTAVSTSAASSWRAGAVVGFVYDGTNWVMMTGIDDNTTTFAASAITSGTLGVARGGTGAGTFTSGAALIGNGTSAITTRSITNSTATTTAITGSTNLVTMNTLRYALNRTTGPGSADTNYSTAMMRPIYAGTSDMTAGTTSLTSGTIYLYYEA